jgi:hypothetical protein
MRRRRRRRRRKGGGPHCDNFHIGTKQSTCYYKYMCTYTQSNRKSITMAITDPGFPTQRVAHRMILKVFAYKELLIMLLRVFVAHKELPIRLLRVFLRTKNLPI